MRLSGVLVLIVIVLGNIGVWAWMNRPHSDLPWSGTIRGVSFAPYQRHHNPLENILPTPEEIDSDLRLLAGKVDSVRLYTALEGMEVVPELAAKYGMRVNAGAWIDDRLGKNEAEITTLLRMVRNNPNIDRVIVGNEALHRGDVTPAQIARYIRKVREKVSVPVSTAEPSYIWLEYPELAREVDYIAIHILPYWEGVPVEHAVDFLLGQYHEIQRRFPDKPVVITEVGWPSAGKSRMQAEPSLVNQALFLRRFLNVAALENIDYNIIEAFDQPWKKEIEWSVGAHWGMLDADRNAKFSWVGPVIEFKEWPLQAGAATILALLPVIFFLYKWNDLRPGGRIFFALLVQFAASLVIWSMSMPVIRDTAPATELMVLVLIPSQIMLLLVVLISGLELTELTWTRNPRRRFQPLPPEAAKRFPKVSLHLPICNEPPHMVKLTLDSLAKLDYPNFEVLVLDNNTRDPETWKPVQEYCEQLGDRFRFFTLGKWPGFKAGALNFGLTQTAPDAEVVGLIDADYVVDKNWLRSLIPYFENEKVGWVQAPQDHREWEDHPFKEMINWEYAGFFHIGMVARNEANAIIQHGTMTLIRKEALVDTGRWAEWCICEDAELGLRLLKHGYDSVYVEHSFGHGLTPDTFLAYKKQRFRWAYGGVQILKGHWKALMPFRKSGLSAAQKYHFVAGWLPWFADAFYLAFTLLSLFWAAGLVLAPRYFDFPLATFVLPTVGVFVAKLIHHLFLYSTRVKCTWKQRLGSAVAGMGLTYSVALAMWQGIFTKSTPFFRTPKCENKAALTQGFLMARSETLLMLGQWLAAGAVLASYGWHDPDARIWALVMVVQSTPFLAALITSMISALPSRSEREAKRDKKKRGNLVPAE
ncbi:glycosyltransferase [Telmatospirillum sp. J64-1]|uniref:glycosyltransferase n=1 Tax=Telmatospirillum sp. J64-1 TaxID=2502183 RepID=UPI00115F77C4|nr:glycosyltransferase [Telmatospirillum sp. J64-1]